MKFEADKFASEAELCSAFMVAATAQGAWIAYPETAGFDILMVRKADGAQIGIEAKLRLNGKVLAQALPKHASWNAGSCGPDYRAVLVPRGGVSDLGPVCAALGITAIRFDRARREYWPLLPKDDSSEWFDQAVLTRCSVPGYVPDVAAGTPCPLKLTDWKIKAIKLAIILEERPITRADFKALHLNPSRWVEPHYGWLERAGEPGSYTRGPNTPDFRAQHPRNYAEIEADKAKWMPAAKAPKERVPA